MCQRRKKKKKEIFFNKWKLKQYNKTYGMQEKHPNLHFEELEKQKQMKSKVRKGRK